MSYMRARRAIMAAAAQGHRSGNTLLVSDTFSRVAAVMGTADTGQAWTQHTGTASTDGSRATFVSAEAWASIDAGRANVDVSVDVSGAAQQYIALRGSTVLNTLIFGFTDGTNTINGFRIVAGAYTNILSVGVGAHTGTLRAVAVGNSITIYFAGAQIGAITEATHATNTRHGLFGDAGVFDNFLVRSA